MRSTTRTTLRDVAAASGVSVTTVSFVLNNNPNQSIPIATRERVQQAARDLGYVPHGTARALREGASRIVVLNIAIGRESNYSRSYIRGLDDELAAHQHVLLVKFGPSSAESTRQVVDAITPRAVLTFGEAYLNGNERDDGSWTGGLAATSALQINHLASRGHTNIAMALPSHGTDLRDVRLRFARESAAALDLAPLTSFTMPSPRDAGTDALQEFRASNPTVTAVAAFDDDVALRTLAAMRDLKLTAPRDLAVIGFDATEYGALATPPLTTVHTDAEAHGRLAARSALGIDISDVDLIPGRVIVRATA
ncbi:LacI family DNA-binding transcriptional regulator [Rhodococcus sp. NPDC056506]|uniref:LacI family DNA-binding transcriptional regulator n=1 Tax=Rhodococcus sp. NPDC056506 TaxID=3345844 RepID=UPI003671AF31